MQYQEFLTRVIDDGIAAARADYPHDDQTGKLRGSVEGFELCRGLTPPQLGDLLTAVNQDAQRRMVEGAADYWYWRCRALEVEWVVNCVSAILMNQGLPLICGYLPTSRGVIKASEIVGVAEE
jgi:hypothetical protein